MSHLFHDLLNELLERLGTPRLDADSIRLVARAIELIDPRLKSFGGYPEGYVAATSDAYHYARALSEMLPPSISLSASNFASDPFLHALFSDTEAIKAALRESMALREYPSVGTELFALMGMRREEKQVFAPAINNDTVRNGVAQTVVYFHSHTISLPAESSAQLREQLAAHFFDSLIRSFAGEMAVGVAQRQELETERDVLALHLRSASGEHAAMEEKLRQVRQQLHEVQQHYALENYHHRLNEFMSEPQQHLHLEQTEIPIDMRGVMRKSSERLAGTFDFFDLEGRDRRRWTLCPVRIRVDELHQAQQRSGAKERWMVI